MKGEIKQTLVDLREFVMKQGSPFMMTAEGGEGGGIAQNALDQMLEQAQAIAREEASVSLQRGLEELHRENQRQLEAIQAQVSMGPGSSDDLMAEIDELRRQSQEQAATSRRQIEAIQSQEPSGGGADAAAIQRQMDDMRAENQRQMDAVRAQQQSSGGDPAAVAEIQRQMDALRAQQQSSAGDPAAVAEMQRQMDAMQAQMASQAAQPALGAQIVQPPVISPQGQVIQVQPGPPPQEAQPSQIIEVQQAPPQPGPAQEMQIPVVQAPPAEVAAQQQQMPPLEIAQTPEMQVEMPPLEMPLEVQPASQAPRQDLTMPAPEMAAPYMAQPVQPLGATAAGSLSAQAPAVSPLAEQLQGNASLDANLLASLIRWVGGVKRRLGATQLPGFIEMYKLTGHLPLVVEKLILHVASLDALPDESSDQIFTLDDVMDSLLQLHAIIYGPGHAVSGSLLGLLEEQGLGDAEVNG